MDTHRHFGKAARACNVTQPTLSMQISKLESTLGVKLFDRTRSPVLTTDIGAALLSQARVVLREAARLSDIRDRLSGTVAGELRLGIIPTLATSILPRIIPVMLKRYPNVTLTVVEEKTDSLVEHISRESVDAAIIASELSPELGYETDPLARLIQIHLFDEPFVGFISEGHPLFEKSSISPADLDQEDIWLLGEGHCFRDQAVALCNPVRKNASVTAQFEIGHLSTLIRLVERGLGMTILPSLTASELEGSLQNRYVRPFSDPVPSRSVRLVRRRHHYKENLVDAVVSVLMEELPGELVTVSGAGLSEMECNET